MSLVESVLELLRAHFLGFEVEKEAGEPAGKSTEEPRSRRRREARRERAVRRQVDPLLARCYAEIELPYGADLRQVRRAWRRLVRQHHPDLHGADPERQRTGTEQVKRLNNAFEELKRRLESGE